MVSMQTTTNGRASIRDLEHLNQELSAVCATALEVGDRLMAEEMEFRIALNQAEIQRRS
jgi:hypothetical protein